MNELLTAALKYAASGWPVFPCREAGKQPLTPKGFEDASADEAIIRGWWKRWPRANVAIPTGTATGTAVIDLDGDRGRATFAELTAQHGDAPPTLESETGNGVHLLFKCPDPPIRNTQGGKGMGLGDGIDTRGEGGYIIVSPSVHPSGALYEWANEAAGLAELPAWLNPLMVHKPRTIRPMPAVPVAADEAERAKRASAYLAAMPGAIQGAGGHSALYAAATAVVHGFDLPPSVGYQILAAEFNPRCSPAWNLGETKDEKDFRRKITQADTKPHDQPRGYLIGEDMGSGGDAEHGRWLGSALLSNAKAVDLPKPSPRQATAPIPSHLLQPSGLVGELVGWINETAIMPQPELALGAALSFVGALVGRKVRTPGDLRTNLYCLGVADSGSGKDHARKVIKSLCSEAGIVGDVLGGEELASDAAILTAVERNPSLLFLLDEIGHLISSSNDQRAMPYQKNIPTLFTKLFSSASTTMLGREYAGKDERQDYDQPNVCLYGSTVPGTLYKGLSPSDISNGFLSRMLVFTASNPDPDRRPVKFKPPPADLVAKLSAWVAYTPEAPAGTGNIAALSKAWPAMITVEPKAAARISGFYERSRKHKSKLRGDRGLDSLWARAAEHAEKVAAVIACGEAGGPVVIDDAAAAYACELVEHLIRGLVVAVQDNVSETVYEGDKQKIIRTIKTLGHATPTQISRKTQGMTPRVRKEAIGDLVESGIINFEAYKPKRGASTIRYRMAEDAA